MDVKTYRAKSMQEALQMVRRELGPDAAVLHTREVGGGLLRWLGAGRQVEVVASAGVDVPSRLPARTQARRDKAAAAARATTPAALTPAASAPSALSAPSTAARSGVGPHSAAARSVAASPAASDSPALPVAASPQPTERAFADTIDFRSKLRDDLKGQLDQLNSLVEDLCRKSEMKTVRETPETVFRLFTDLIDAEVGEELARELIDRVRTAAAPEDRDDLILMKSRIARLIEDEIGVSGPIRVLPGERRLVALVGPTGVGKTTTIAKLAANFRLREQLQVGLITVDTYRIAAVDQLRTYAEIIDLPMEVVSTPRELREAIARFAHLDLVLLDTAGRSPRDDVQIQELKSLLGEAKPDEVHLVLSAVSSVQQLRRVAENFAPVGVTSLLLTKLDEATGLGNLLPLLRGSKLRLSYLTNGQNVPDDIEPAEKRKLARIILGVSRI